MTNIRMFNYDNNDIVLDEDAFYEKLEKARPQTARPFSESRMNIVASVGKAIMKQSNAETSPFVTHFSFWIRAAALKKIANSFEDRLPAQTHARPRGLVFHLPPQNVETVFLYSWILSYLVGNANITRLPENISSEMREICNLFLEQLDAAGDTSQIFVYFPSQSDISTKVSAISDARVVWGGTQKVNLFSTVPLRGGGKSLWFGDRFSFSVMDGDVLSALSDEKWQDLAQRFYNDMFIFDQMACSSPHILYLIGDKEQCAPSLTRFKAELSKVAQAKSDGIATGHIIRKMVEGMSAVAHEQAKDMDWSDNTLTTVTISAPQERVELRVGGGFLSIGYIDKLEDVSTLIREHDQTISYFGVESTAIDAIMRLRQGSGVTRVVPVGTALDFDFIWDGYDIPFELTRLTRVI